MIFKRGGGGGSGPPVPALDPCMFFYQTSDALLYKTFHAWHTSKSLQIIGKKMLKFGIQIITGIKVKILLLYSAKAQQRVKMSTRLKDFVNGVRLNM